MDRSRFRTRLSGGGVHAALPPIFRSRAAWMALRAGLRRYIGRRETRGQAPPTPYRDGLTCLARFLTDAGRRILRLTIFLTDGNYCCMSTDVSMMLDALADPTRQRVIQLLRGGPRRAGELAKASGTSAPTMSRHLRVLLRAGIVGDDRPSDDARARVFWLRPEAIGAVRAWLDQLQVAGDEQLAAFKKHVERRDAT